MGLRVMNPNRPEWTEQQTATLYELARLGLDDPEIGHRMGKSAGAIKQRRERLRIPRAMQKKYTWDEIQDNRLTELWAQGAAAVEIARTLAEEFSRPFSKNAIIGRANRLQVPPRKAAFLTGGEGHGEKKVRIRVRRRLSVMAPRTPLLPPSQDHAWQLFGELGYGTCRFIQGEPRALETLMCGLPQERDSYCQYHYWITHRIKRASVASRAVVPEVAPSVVPPVGKGAASLSSPMVGNDDSVGESTMRDCGA